MHVHKNSCISYNYFCCAVGSTFATEDGFHFIVTIKNHLTLFSADLHKLLVEAVDIEIALYQFTNNWAIGNKIDKGDVLDAVADEDSGDGGGELVALVADHLRHLEESRLEGGGAGADEGGVGSCKDIVGVVIDNLYVAGILGDIFSIELLPYQTHTGDDEMVLRMARGDLEHDREHATQLHLATPRKDSDVECLSV